MSDHSPNTNRAHLFLWILIACLLVSLVGSIGIFILLGARKSPTAIRATSTPRQTFAAPVPGQAPKSFAEVAEADVPGRYKVVDGEKIMYMFLNEDHTY